MSGDCRARSGTFQTAGFPHRAAQQTRRYHTGQQPPARSRGVALILFVLLLVAIGAGVLIEAVQNSSPARVNRDDRTSRSLAEAKAALIAWAVSHPSVPGRLPFPDRGADIGGFDGQSDCVNAPIAVTAFHVHGQFPWLGDDASGSGCAPSTPTWPLTMELVDSSGTRLWYAVSNKLVANTLAPTINPGMLDQKPVGSSWITLRDAMGAPINGPDDNPLKVAAVIIAPGKAIGNQVRGSVVTANAAYAADFLDTVTITAGATPGTYSNADADNDFIMSPHSSTTDQDGDGLLDNTGDDSFNDRLVYITAEELLRATERRVLGEVAVALKAYRDADPPNGQYPWLSPFCPDVAQPLCANSAARSDGVPGTSVGHLAFNNADDVDSHVQDTGFTVVWSANGLVVATDPALPDTNFSVIVSDGPDLLPGTADDITTVRSLPSLTTMQNNASAAAEGATKIFAMPSAPNGGNPSCVWSGANDKVVCSASVTENSVYDVQVFVIKTTPLPVSFSFETLPVDRTFTISMAFEGTSGAPGSDNGARVRNVNSGLSHKSYPNASAASIFRVQDSIPGAPNISVTRVLTINDGDAGTVDVAGIYLEPTAGGMQTFDLPAWFSDQGWQQYVLVKYAGKELADPLIAPPCSAGADCLQVDVESAIAVQNDVRAIVVGAGWQLGEQDRIDSPSIDDYFENTNANPAASTVQRGAWCQAAPCWSATPFNDQIRIVETVP